MTTTTENETDTESKSESEYSDNDDEEELVIRMKWCADGSKTLDEIITKLESQIEYIRSLKIQGYELTRVMEDDWGFAKIVNEPINESPIPIEVSDTDSDK